MIAMAALTMGLAIASCSDANEYEDADTNNPSWSTTSHPASLASTTWVAAQVSRLMPMGKKSRALSRVLISYRPILFLSR